MSKRQEGRKAGSRRLIRSLKKALSVDMDDVPFFTQNAEGGKKKEEYNVYMYVPIGIQNFLTPINNRTKRRPLLQKAMITSLIERLCN